MRRNTGHSVCTSAAVAGAVGAQVIHEHRHQSLPQRLTHGLPHVTARTAIRCRCAPRLAELLRQHASGWSTCTISVCTRRGVVAVTSSADCWLGQRCG